ncbi:RNA polymerase sigma-54 factor [Nymphon striatum]|nr:RNA polymerase sigma-54 factor [Nymphon striatum]
MKLIQLPTQAFEQRLKQELEENPALEGGKEEPDNIDDEFEDAYEEESDADIVNTEDINIDDYLSDDEVPEYRTKANNYSTDDEVKSMPHAAGISFNQYLITQLNTSYLNDEEWSIAETQQGVAARSLEECLIIQLRRKEVTPSIELATAILEKSFDQFTKKHYKKLIQKYSITEDELKDAISEIERLNPKPGGSYAGNNRTIEHVVPDFSIRIAEGELELTLNGRNAPELHVSKEYNNMLKGYKDTKKKSKSQKDTVMFIKQKLDAAKWFIDAIRQRQQTLFITMNSIMHYQKEYFLTGDERNLRPMILKDIADEIKMDVSTVSRVANSKYVDTPYGTKLIKEFFSESMKNDQGEDVSTKEIKKILETVIRDEPKKKPLTDDKLAKILKEKGYPIARRTVAKYREQLDIPVARLRKEI